MTYEKILASLRSELNEQTAQIRWTELERFFASGSVISVAPVLDLIDVGAHIAADVKPSVERWMNACLLHKTFDGEASTWLKYDTLLWVVVVKPWILVQHERITPSAPKQ